MWLKEWVPVLSGLATVLTATLAIAAGYVSFRKFVGGRILRPNVVMELDSVVHADANHTLLAVNLRVRNVGARAITIRGDGGRDVHEYQSYVGAVPLTQADLSAGNLVWDAGREHGKLLDEQSRGLFVHGEAPSSEARPFRQDLAPGQEAGLPFLLLLPSGTVAARVRAQLYISDIGGKHGDHLTRDRVIPCLSTNGGTTHDCSPRASGTRTTAEPDPSIPG